MNLSFLVPADSLSAVEYTADGGETILTAEPGEFITITLDEEGEGGFAFRLVEKVAAAPSFEQPRPDSIVSAPELNSATAPGAQATVEAAGNDTPAGEPLGETVVDDAEFDEVDQGEQTTDGTDTGTASEPGPDTNVGGAGEDTFTGGQGEDTFTAPSGDASMEGGQGADTNVGGPGEDSQTGGQTGDQTQQNGHPSDDDIRQVMKDLETQPSVEKTASGKIEVNTINEALAKKGFAPIKARDRDRLTGL